MLDLRSELNVVQTKPTNTALSLAPKEDSSSNAIPIKKKQDPMEENSINDKPSSLSTPPNKGQNLFSIKKELIVCRWLECFVQSCHTFCLLKNRCVLIFGCETCTVP